MRSSATAFAPATVANVAVGFDILGFAIDGVGDTVTVSTLHNSHEIRLDSVRGLSDGLPLDSSKNTAVVALRAMADALKLSHGFSLEINKGIPLASGMGGSAASAVGAVVAANALLKKPLPKEALLEFALIGEAAASGAIHGDNVGPCLIGGLTLVLPTSPMRAVPLLAPPEIHATLVHPHLRVETRTARTLLRESVALQDHARQSAWLAGFIAGCTRGDFDLIGASMQDTLIEPQRAHLVPGLKNLQDSARDHGALGCSISGSGPSVFAWSRSREAAEKIRADFIRIFAAQGLDSEGWVSPLASPGARVLP